MKKDTSVPIHNPTSFIFDPIDTKFIRADNTASVGTTLKFYISHLSQLQSFLTPSGSKQFSTVVRLNQGRGWKQCVFRNLLPGVLFAKKAYTGEVRKGFPARGSVYTYRSLVKKKRRIANHLLYDLSYALFGSLPTY